MVEWKAWWTNACQDSISCKHQGLVVELLAIWANKPRQRQMQASCGLMLNWKHSKQMGNCWLLGNLQIMQALKGHSEGLQAWWANGY